MFFVNILFLIINIIKILVDVFIKNNLIQMFLKTKILGNYINMIEALIILEIVAITIIHFSTY